MKKSSENNDEIVGSAHIYLECVTLRIIFNCETNS